MSGKIYYKGKEYMGGEGTTTEFEELWIRDEVNNVKKGLVGTKDVEGVATKSGTASGNESIAYGTDNVAGNDNTVCFGYGNNVNSKNTLASGRANTINAANGYDHFISGDGNSFIGSGTSNIISGNSNEVLSSNGGFVNNNIISGS